MTNALTETRERLRKLLEDGGLFAFSTAPEKVVPPFAYVGPNEPYLEYEGANFGCVIARFQVGVVARPGTNDVRAEEIDDLVLQALAAVTENPDDPHGFVVEGVDRPGQIALAGQGNHIAAPINIAIEIELSGGTP